MWKLQVIGTKVMFTCTALWKMVSIKSMDAWRSWAELQWWGIMGRVVNVLQKFLLEFLGFLGDNWGPKALSGPRQSAEPGLFGRNMSLHLCEGRWGRGYGVLKRAERPRLKSILYQEKWLKLLRLWALAWCHYLSLNNLWWKDKSSFGFHVTLHLLNFLKIES